MATTPRSTLTVSQAAAIPSAGSDVCVIFGAVPDNADRVVRRYSGSAGVLSRHGYSPAVDYAAIHSSETGESFDFVGLPIDVPGVVGQIDVSGNTGSAEVSIAVGAKGALDACDVRVVVKAGGVVGTSLILLDISIDGGRSYKTARVGTATTYTIPYVGLVLTLSSGDTLIDGDTILTARSTAPLFAADDFNAVREKLSERPLPINSLMAIGDSPSLAFAQSAVAELNEFQTANQRYSFVRVSVEDRYSGKMSTHDGTLTFNETTDTITRSVGSWISDGFRVGQTVTIDGTASNDGSFTIVTLTASVMTLETGDVVAAATPDIEDVSIVVSESIEDWADRVDAKYNAIDGEFRISLGRGFGFKLSPILGATLRRPVTWAANVAQYQHDVHIPTWQPVQGALSGWSLRDLNDELVEYDDRVHGGTASLNKFTSFRSWPTKSSGVFISQDVTRDTDGALLTHVVNVATVNKACTVCQSATEDEVGQRVEVDDTGRGTTSALALVKGRVDGKIDRVMLVNAGEGLPVSGVSWTPDPDSILSGAEPVLRGTLDILLNGLVHSVETVAKVR